MFKVGDKVIDSQRGEGVVVEVEVEVEAVGGYIISSRIDEYVYTYTSDGKFNAAHKYSSLFHLEGYTPPSSPEPIRRPDLAVDTKMIVGERNVRRYFAYWDEHGKCCCFLDGKTSFTEKDICAWDLWSLYEGDE